MEVNHVYDDSQNVHNTDINNACIRKVNLLVREYSHRDPLYETVCKNMCIKHRANKALIGAVLSFIKINTSHFGGGHTLLDVLNSICNYILQDIRQEDMMDNLYTEMLAMHNYCATGHLTRLMNVFNGFDEKFTVYMADDDRNKALVKACLDIYVQSNEDIKNIILMCNDTNELSTPLYEMCVEKLKNENISDKFIQDIVNKYLGLRAN